MKAFILSLFYLILLQESIVALDKTESIIMNIYYSKETGKYKTVKSDKVYDEAIANAIYNKSYETTGWDFLTITSYDKKDNKYSDSNKAYAMGYLEGVLTKDRIYTFYRNIKFTGVYDDDSNLREFMKKNINYMNETSLKNKDTDPYWEHIHYILQQLKGLYDGYASVAEKEKLISFEDFIILSSYTDANDAKSYSDKSFLNYREMTTEEMRKYFILNSHCSALVKRAEDYSDLWFGHTTWDFYNVMIRIFKEYRFVSNKGNENNKVIVFPSYPAVLFSTDDFYYLDSKLLVMETSIAIYNFELYKEMKPESVLTWVRVMLANKLAKSAEDWIEIFKKENSGTYNCQFTILDLNKVDLKQKNIEDKALMIIEQLPGETDTLDVTKNLKDEYWASYNIPYSKIIFRDIGYEDAIDISPELEADLDYEKNSRAKIIKREQKNVKSNEDIKKFLRYNKYKTDEFSNNDPRNTIACRYDLLDDQDENRCYGATDAKFVSLKDLIEGKKIYIISGPTNEDQPTFSWANTNCVEKRNKKFYPDNLEQNRNINWIEYKIQSEDLKKTPGKDVETTGAEEGNKGSKLPLILIIIGVVILLIVVAIILYVCIFLKKNEEMNEKIKNISFQNGDNNDNENNEDGDGLLLD